jgi:hypothetical protein
MFCRGCGYALIGLPSNRCPECGREFDPENRKTFLARPRRVVLRRIIKIALVFVCASAPLACYLGYLDWRLRREAKAIQILTADNMSVTTYDTTPGWLKPILRGRAAWLWKRADEVEECRRPCFQNLEQCMAALGNLNSLRRLDLGHRGSNLSRELKKNNPARRIQPVSTPTTD